MTTIKRDDGWGILSCCLQCRRNKLGSCEAATCADLSTNSNQCQCVQFRISAITFRPNSCDFKAGEIMLYNHCWSPDHGHYEFGIVLDTPTIINLLLKMQKHSISRQVCDHIHKVCLLFQLKRRSEIRRSCFAFTLDI